MIYVYSCIYYHKKDHYENQHIFGEGLFKEVCQIVAETWVYETNNVYTIVDDREEGEK